MASVLLTFADMSDITVPFITVKQVKSEFYLAAMPASAVVAISYTAVRGVDTEEGAVQRVLNPRRITSVKEFTLQVGHYPGTIALNWVNETNSLKQSNGHLQIEIEEHSAQIIDGQHRVAGIKAAIADRAAAVLARRAGAVVEVQGTAARLGHRWRGRGVDGPQGFGLASGAGDGGCKCPLRVAAVKGLGKVER